MTNEEIQEIVDLTLALIDEDNSLTSASIAAMIENFLKEYKQ